MEKFLLQKDLLQLQKNGADYIKFQMFRTSDHITKKAKQAHYQIRNLKKNQISLRWLRNWNLVKTI